ncbi:MAG: CHAP domain-containing protein [Candidatus Dormibacteraeota bacterium]|nr:CHAP domain-containing protein [Candidatus Dormibacteraeota bacterium]
MKRLILCFALLFAFSPAAAAAASPPATASPSPSPSPTPSATPSAPPTASPSAAPTPSHSPSPSPSPSASPGGPPPPPSPEQKLLAEVLAALDQAQAEQKAGESQLAPLNGQIELARAHQSAAAKQAAQDQAEIDSLRRAISANARQRYETRGLDLQRLLNARSLSDVWATAAESRLVADRSQRLLERLQSIQSRDKNSRSTARAELNKLLAQRGTLLDRLTRVKQRIDALKASLHGASDKVAALHGFNNGSGVVGGLVESDAGGWVPTSALANTTGAPGQCTWYAEQLWYLISDPNSPSVMGDGADVAPNLSKATGRPIQLEPEPGAIVSWERPLLDPYHGHVAYVAAVERSADGQVVSYTVWEMNYVGPFRVDTRQIPWSGTNPQIVFLAPPQPIDPIAEEAALKH